MSLYRSVLRSKSSFWSYSPDAVYQSLTGVPRSSIDCSRFQSFTGVPRFQSFTGVPRSSREVPRFQSLTGVPRSSSEASRFQSLTGVPRPSADAAGTVAGNAVVAAAAAMASRVTICSFIFFFWFTPVSTRVSHERISTEWDCSEGVPHLTYSFLFVDFGMMPKCAKFVLDVSLDDDLGVQEKGLLVHRPGFIYLRPWTPSLRHSVM
ncbi:hypothetical protein GE09DRAFT_1093580, partial [Coniochaeta sp. 2T2.1]